MADSYTIYTASGAQDTFNITFGYLDPTHVYVTVDNVPGTFDFPSGAQVQLDAMPTIGKKVKVYRQTPRTTRQVVWQNASNLTATDLNASDLQLLYITQEAFDKVNDAILKDNTGLYDALTTRIINVGTPTNPADAATKAYVDASTVDVVDDAEDARDAAIQAKVDAQAVLAQVQVIYDNFDDRYLGQKSSAPTLDNDGNALIDGALYFNTTTNQMNVYDLGTTTWIAIDTAVADGSITTNKLANLAVTTGKLALNAVDSTILANGAVSTAAKIADNIITYVKILSTAIASAADITAGTASKLVSAASLKTWYDALSRSAPDFTSSPLTFTVNSVQNIAHGLGVKPSRIELWGRATTSAGGYVSGDEFIIPYSAPSGGSYYNMIAAIDNGNTTDIRVIMGASYSLLNKTTGAGYLPVTADIRVIVKAWK